MQLRRFVPVGLALAFALSACGGSGSTEPEPRTVANLQCAGPSGQLFNCDLELPSAGGFEVKLVSTACQAHGNTLRLTKPVVQTLTDDGCYEPSGKTWTFAGPFNPGTAVGMQVEAAELENPPVLRVTGSYPLWLIEFEDGFDDDFNDMILTVKATP